MKIAFLGLRGLPAAYGGADRVVEEISTRLAQHRHSVLVYCWKHSKRDRPKEYKGVRLVYLPTFQARYFGTLIHTFVSCLDVIKRDIDIVHINNLENAPLALIPRLFGKKVVVQPHGPAWPILRWGTFRERFLINLKIRLSRIYFYFCRFAVAYLSHKIVIISCADREYLLERKQDKLCLITNGCVVPPLAEPNKMLRLGLRPQEYILTVGRIVPRKGFHHLIKAFRCIETDLKLVIVGGPLNKNAYGSYLIKLTKNDERIVFLGPVYDALLTEIFSNPVAYVHPSESEGQSVALLEALSYGNCVVASDAPESVEVAGENAHYFKSGDYQSLRKVLEDLINNNTGIREKGIGARKYIEKYYRWEDRVQKYEQLYMSLLDREINRPSAITVSENT